MPHLIDRTVSSSHSYRRIVGIANVGFGVVVGISHRNNAILWQKDGRLKAVDGLAIDVPVANENEPFLFTIGKDGITFELFAKVVSMWIDSEDVYVYRKFEMIFDDKGRVARGDIEGSVVLKLQKHGVRCGRFVGKIETDGGLHSLGFAGRFQVHVEDEIVAGVESPGHAAWFDESG